MQGTVDREFLLNISSNLLFSEGLNSLTIRTLAKEAKCSPQPIYSNFENIEEVKNNTLTMIFKDLGMKLGQALKTTETDKLWAFHVALFKSLLQAPGLALTIVSNYEQVAYQIRKTNNELIRDFNLKEQEYGRKIVLNDVLTKGWLLTSQQIHNFYQLKLTRQLTDAAIDNCVQQIMTTEFAFI
ncbi:MAG: TetR/AcrR family transcriptional regulator [Lactobacillus sp.]|jgi:AcrR family transcriptional regulator|nr:TetR/AcrR family transcriptional regulator [Lactobacillus sp.]